MVLSDHEAVRVNHLVVVEVRQEALLHAVGVMPSILVVMPCLRNGNRHASQWRLGSWSLHFTGSKHGQRAV